MSSETVGTYSEAVRLPIQGTLSAPGQASKAPKLNGSGVVDTRMAEFAAPHIVVGAPNTRVLSGSFARLSADGDQRQPAAIVDTRRLNDFRRVNCFLLEVNRCLPMRGCFAFPVQTLDQRRCALRRRLPVPLFHVVYVLDFLVHRVLPKLPGFKRIYFAMSNGHGRAISRSETFGRLIYSGFEIVKTSRTRDLLYVLARKVSEPLRDEDPSYGPLCRLSRVGRGGRIIHVYKLRTMHPYAEYLQDYVYRNNDLAGGGKFNGDFRVTTWGRVLRRLWLDELPMLVNWMKGDLKLVGVRPLTQQYLSLYPEPFRSYRQRSKPGLVPPYYADLPSTLEEIIASEDAYLRAYEVHPVMTDCRYLLRAIYNIIFRGARSR